jgi:hypothetical protein
LTGVARSFPDRSTGLGLRRRRIKRINDDAAPGDGIIDHHDHADCDRSGKQRCGDPNANPRPRADIADVLLAELVAQMSETQRVFVL